MASKLRLIVLGVGVIVFLSIGTICEEALFRIPGWTHAFFMVCFSNTFVMPMYCYSAASTGRSDPKQSLWRGARQSWVQFQETGAHRIVLAVSLVYVATNMGSKHALNFVSVPTQLVLKSGKLIPVMIGGVLINGRRYSVINYLAALMLIGGVIVFTLASKSGMKPFNDSIFGFLLIGVSLMLDAVLGNMQEKCMKAGITVDQMVLAQNVVGIGLAAVAAAADHQIETGFGLLPDALKLLVVWTVSVQLGTRLTMSVIKEYDSTIAVVVTSLRKVVSICGSFLLFPKAVSIWHAVGVALVIGSGFVQAFEKTWKTKKQTILPTFQTDRLAPSQVDNMQGMGGVANDLSTLTEGLQNLFGGGEQLGRVARLKRYLS